MEESSRPKLRSMVVLSSVTLGGTARSTLPGEKITSAKILALRNAKISLLGEIPQPKPPYDQEAGA